LNPEHFTIFDEYPDIATRDVKTTYAIYKRCLFYMDDIEEYRLFLSFFIESYSAMSLSLLDVSSHLINDIYHFGLSSDTLNFGNIIETYKQKRTCDDFYDFLMLHKANKKGKTQHANHTWIDPLAEIRHSTTHRPITDICDTVFSKRKSIYAQIREQRTEFILNQDLFPAGTKDVRLSDFVKETFVGLQQFVGELYDRLSQAINRTGGLPPY
ncbi:MAG: hypothetical protein M3R61_06160, partial [Chloroflexota bacterium]|nr:hypothetical protein [Chloroflexota bacterium]